MATVRTAKRRKVKARGRGPLAGIKVLDLTRVVAGPYCTLMLADLGADVVKIEEPERGDELRWVTRYPGRSADDEDYFYALNRSKRSIGLNLKDPADRKLAQSLAVHADVVVENFAPGVADRLGMGWKALKRRNPRLIYCAISGFGQTGPYRSRLALDPIVQAIAGAMSVTGEPERAPMLIGAPLGDVGAGMFGACAIVAALHSVRREGKGCFIDISMQAAMLAMLGPRMGEALQAGVAPGRHGNQNPMRVPANNYRTRDGKYLCVMVQHDGHWEPFCSALQRRDWYENPRYASMKSRLQHRTELNAQVAAQFLTRKAQYWWQRLERARVPFAPVNDYVEAFDDPQVAHRGLVRTLLHPRSGKIRVVGTPWIMSVPQSRPKPPPLLGQHRSQVVIEWLGKPGKRG